MRAEIERLKARKGRASIAIFAFAEHGHMPWRECYARATPKVQQAYDAAQAALDAAEQAAIDKGRAYRGAFGMLVWSR